MVDSSDEALWQVALLGDGRAFAALFRTHGDAVFRQALRFSVDPADAEEVAAAAFFELWRSRARVRLVEGSVLPWLLVTAANLGWNGLRSARRRDALLRRVVEQHDRRSAEPVDEVDAGVDRIDRCRAPDPRPPCDRLRRLGGRPRGRLHRRPVMRFCVRRPGACAASGRSAAAR